MTETDSPVFSGWPAEATAFLAELADDNTRTFWTENAHRYRAALLEPTRALAVALTPEFGPPRVFRPYVDRRFRPNADPYRTDTGITVAGPGGTPYVAVLSARGWRCRSATRCSTPASCAATGRPWPGRRGRRSTRCWSRCVATISCPTTFLRWPGDLAAARRTTRGCRCSGGVACTSTARGRRVSG